MLTLFKTKATALFMAAVLMFSLLAAGLVPSSMVSALDSKSAACEGVGLGAAGCDGTAASTKISSLVNDIVNLISVIVGIAAVIMIIIAGFKYITSGGDTSKVASAKSTLVYAIVGLVIVALAQFIVHFVLSKV
jgi:uncharacterized membrane protein YuzA (DUF378 family)